MSPQGDFVGRTMDLLVGGTIKFKFVAVGVSITLLVAAVRLPVSSEFFPKDMRDQFAIQIWLPETATIAQTDAAAQQVEAILQALSPTTDEDGNPTERIRAMRTMVGGGGTRWYLSWDPEGSKANYAEILVRTTDPPVYARLGRAPARNISCGRCRPWSRTGRRRTGRAARALPRTVGRSRGAADHGDGICRYGDAAESLRTSQGDDSVAAWNLGR